MIRTSQCHHCRTKRSISRRSLISPHYNIRMCIWLQCVCRKVPKIVMRLCSNIGYHCTFVTYKLHSGLFSSSTPPFNLNSCKICEMSWRPVLDVYWRSKPTWLHTAEMHCHSITCYLTWNYFHKAHMGSSTILATRITPPHFSFHTTSQKIEHRSYEHVEPMCYHYRRTMQKRNQMHRCLLHNVN